ncbi:cysteine-rich receptor-like protein kinase 10 [Neltuma alba]|uniref:cysteine-rich receptor-like protein kinase 10 n=1 Tax=Neltuma alba TaxID=207710 RepID=UPI0010A2A9A0|nr:cysteine-rich receptor-like protein kinase 10 [Prosopis alba]
MSTSSLVLLSLLSHLTILCAQLPVPDWACTYCFHDRGNFTNTSTYQSNFNIVLSNLTSNTEIDYGFYNLSHGQHPDRVSTIGLCRGDITPDECHACLKNASLILPMSCPNMREAMAGSDECFLRQSNCSIFRVMESNASCIWWNRYDTAEQDKYNEVSGLLEGLRSKAKNGDSLLKYAEAYQTAPNLQNIFGAVQCTPDLSQQDCSDCLKTAISELPNCCFAKRGGRVIKPSCNVRYENYRFFGPMAEDSPPLLPSPLSPPTTSTSKGHSRQSIITSIAIVLPTAAIILVLICVFSICWRMRKGREAVQTEAELDGQIEFLESLQLDFETIRTATDKFSDANKLGQGGFGPVYKGKLHNGEVAVKRLSNNSGQGAIEFKNEVKLVAKLQHRNLARLIGFCLERGERLLIYEFLPNKSLEYLLFGKLQVLSYQEKTYMFFNLINLYIISLYFKLTVMIDKRLHPLILNWFFWFQLPELRSIYCFHSRGNFTNSSTYQTTLNIVLSDLTSNTAIDYGFYNLSHGQYPYRVSAIGLCRGDIKPNECRSCLKNASVLVPMLCPNMKEAMGGYDECFLRYSNRSILGVMESDASFILWNKYDTTDQDKYNEVVSELLDGLRSKAKNGDSLRKYAEANQTGPNFYTIYGAVQCTPDLSQQDCSDCLKTAISELPDCCFTKRGGRVIKPSCNVRYENYRFFGPVAEHSQPPPPPPPLSPPRTPTSKGHSRKSIKTIIAIVLPTAATILLLISVFSIICLRMRKTRDAIQKGAELDDETEFIESLQLDFETIRSATDNFSDANKLGQGGFGPVYKGKLHNGEEVAVKRLSKNSGQGDIEFKNEVKLMAKLQHRNLARLRGFCLEREERLLIYEFLPNKSLDYLLFDPNHRAQLNWEMRHKIIMGVARGLHYLHQDSQLRIIHRDLKASNILLDAELNPKISDFGMARLFAMDQSQSNTSRIVGTYGYMAPEYAMRGQFSIKSDVFSFGVLILEIICGKKNNSIFHEENILNLLSFVWKNWREGTTSNIVDPVLNNASSNEIKRCIHIGLLCVQENVADRPTMASVALMLDSHSITLSVPSEPPFLMYNRSLPETNSGENNSSGATRSAEGGRDYVEASTNEVTITELHPR